MLVDDRNRIDVRGIAEELSRRAELCRRSEQQVDKYSSSERAAGEKTNETTHESADCVPLD